MVSGRVVAVVLLLLVLAGCAPSAGPAEPAAPPGPLPAERQVFVLHWGSNGFSSWQQQTVRGADLVVYGDGRVFTAAPGENAAGQPTAYALARVDPLAVARFAAEAEQRGVIRAGSDLGTATVTDQATTTVLLDGPGGRQVVAAYAFEERFETGLTDAQRRARAELREIIGAAAALADGASTTRYSPDRVQVVEFPGTRDDGGPAIAWPGPDPATFIQPPSRPGGLPCGTLSDGDARRAYAAARDNRGGRWLVGGRSRLLAVAVLLPGQPGCAG